MTTTHILETAGADVAYDVHGPLPTADGRPPLLMIAQPMDASGFGALASHFPDRTVVTYDPRGLGRSTRSDGRTDHSPTVQGFQSPASELAMSVPTPLCDRALTAATSACSQSASVTGSGGASSSRRASRSSGSV